MVGRDQTFSREEVSKEEAAEFFRTWARTTSSKSSTTWRRDRLLYSHGEFVDLCRGPMCPARALLKAFKLTSWPGPTGGATKERPMLQRIYGTAWPNPKHLKQYLDRLEEAASATTASWAQLDLFSFHEEAGPGMVFWHPKGALVRTILEDFERKEHLARLRDRPGAQMLKRDLWERSGHYENYRENMYFTEIDDQAYGIKPMNCLAHMLIYKSRVRSYRDLPVRYFELGTVHRHEKSGVLHGLLRVRQFTQDDAHIICRPDQLQDEIIGVVRFVQDIMGCSASSTSWRSPPGPKRAIGSDEDWERATAALTSSLEAMGCPTRSTRATAPSTDPRSTSSSRTPWTAAGNAPRSSVISPCRSALICITWEDGERHRPVMLHRVVLAPWSVSSACSSSTTPGRFPVWLAPVQARVLTVTDAHNKFAEKVWAIFAQERGIRAKPTCATKSWATRFAKPRWKRSPTCWSSATRKSRPGA